jgi:hypothetical protein
MQILNYAFFGGIDKTSYFLLFLKRIKNKNKNRLQIKVIEIIVKNLIPFIA